MAARRGDIIIPEPGGYTYAAEEINRLGDSRIKGFVFTQALNSPHSLGILYQFLTLGFPLMFQYRRYYNRQGLGMIEPVKGGQFMPNGMRGGLIKSLGTWPEVLALRRREERLASNQRILEDGEFVNSVLSEIDKIGKDNLRLTPKQMSVSSLFEKVCKVHKISIGELRSGSRRHEIVEARRIVSWLAVTELGYSEAEVARYLGVTTSCITRAVSSGKGPAKEDYT